MPKICVLPIQLVNKIAAGEVVERPASVVKEFIENSLDAGASRIDVAIADGGRKSISVADDGAGMSAEDLALAFAPHATSKLAGEEDLFAISTMGFRGEALASVASISHAHIRTCRRSDQSGYELIASGGDIGQTRPCPAPPGTTVTVRDLFYNTPARRKFLRTASTEMGHITEQVTRLALPHPQVAFTLTHNDRELQNLPAVDTTAQRAADLFGPGLAESLLGLSRRGRGVNIAGLIAPPSAARATGKWQYFFLNGRYIRDRVLSHALREAYRGLTEPSRFPAAFIFVELDPAEVDLNVHPTKIEVRFGDSQAVHGELLAALKETLNKADLTPTASLEAAAGETGVQEAGAGAPEQQRDSLRQALADFFKSKAPSQPRFSFTDGRSKAASQADRHQPAFEPTQAKPQAAPSPADQLATRAVPAPDAGAPLHEAIQIHDSYIVAACEDGIEIIDQHALHERLVYNDLVRRLTQPAGPGAANLAAQRMLIPETLSVTPAQVAAMEANAELLARLGIEVSVFGPTGVAIQQLPSLLAQRGIAPGEFVREVLDMLAEDETANAEQLLEQLLQMVACKAAVKAGDRLTDQEIDSLLARRAEAEKASSCPHGRPTTLKLTLKDLARQFKRT